jgi:hypothetical protein
MMGREVSNSVCSSGYLLTGTGRICNSGLLDIIRVSITLKEFPFARQEMSDKYLKG